MVNKPAAAVPVKPVAPAATPATEAKATSNKVVEGQCAAVKEVSHDTEKHEASKKANAPWGNRKKVVNP
jgi:hypothetical protein